MDNIIWLSEPIDPKLCPQFNGTFEVTTDWSACTVKLQLGFDGLLKGQFQTGQQTLKMIGNTGINSNIFGFLLEPLASLPVGIFKLHIQGEALTLEFDIPDFEALLGHCTTETLTLHRMTNTSSQNPSIPTPV